jgi:TPR repeat protein
MQDADSGDAQAQYALGGFYERGDLGLPQDYTKAATWYRRAAEQGHAGAQLYLGILLAQGKGTDRDVVEAYKWIALAKGGNALDRAAAAETQGRLVALMTLAQVSEGEWLSRKFVPTKGRDDELSELQRAAETGSMIAQYKLATFYSQTRLGNTERNNALVVKWMTLAAQQGFAPALVQLGAVYQLRGVPADSKKVLEWTYKAAEQGYSDAQVELSDIYSDIYGTGADKDLVAAYMWLKVAIDQGETSFDPSWECIPRESRVDMQYMVPRMKELVSVMTADQITEGNRLAGSFVPKRNRL